jgi:hypothetical protein
MRWRALVVLATAGLVVLVTAGPALAKGADQATIVGPGLTRPIVVGADGAGGGEPGSGGPLATLSEGSGLFLAMFGSGSGGGPGLASRQPDGPLGPKYELTYRVPNGDPTPATLTQDLYPLAAGGPLTYTRAGQPAFGGTAVGGWYRAPAGFAALLATLGVPGVTPAANTAPGSTAPGSTAAASTAAANAAASPGPGARLAGDTAGRTGSVSTGYWIAIGAVVLVGGAAVVALVYRRRAAHGSGPGAVPL